MITIGLWLLAAFGIGQFLIVRRLRPFHGSTSSLIGAIIGFILSEGIIVLAALGYR